MSVIRLRAGQACPVCGSTTGLPHASLRDCESAERESREGLERPRLKRGDRDTTAKRLKSRLPKQA
jgi:hypothetical protein